MSFQSFENMPAASPNALHDVHEQWRGWLGLNGDYRLGDSTDPTEGIFGVYLPDDPRSALDSQATLVAAAQPTYRRIFTGELGKALCKRVPRAVGVLGIGPRGFHVTFGAAYRPTAGPRAPIGELVPAAFLLAVPDPVVEVAGPGGDPARLKTRGYVIRVHPNNRIVDERNDTTVDGVKLVDGSYSEPRPPRISMLECQVLEEMAQACAYLVPPPLPVPQEEV